MIQLRDTQIATATATHAWNMAPRMRKADVLEVRAAIGLDPLQTLLLSIQISYESWAWTAGPNVVCMFGVVAKSALSHEAQPWMLTTPDVDSRRLQFLRGCRDIADFMAERHPLLSGWVDARNKRGIRWLEWMGFNIDRHQGATFAQQAFYKFTRGA